VLTCGIPTVLLLPSTLPGPSRNFTYLFLVIRRSLEIIVMIQRVRVVQ
jgi:hypothetical protein